MKLNEPTNPCEPQKSLRVIDCQETSSNSRMVTLSDKNKFLVWDDGDVSKQFGPAGISESEKKVLTRFCRMLWTENWEGCF